MVNGVFVLAVASRVPAKGGAKTVFVVEGHPALCEVIAQRQDGQWMVEGPLYGAATSALCDPLANQ
jgi:hypothetical protein